MADIRGNNGNNVLNGTAGADRIRADGGNDTVNGRGGNDQVEGDDGNDRLFGGAGNDTVDGGQGNDILTGGAGADQFRFGNNEGFDRITDFTDGVDRIKISAPGVANFGDLTLTTDAAGNAVVHFVSLGDASDITLVGISVGQLSASDFIFSPG